MFPCFAKVEYKDIKLLGAKSLFGYKLITKDAVLEFRIFAVAIFFRKIPLPFIFQERVVT